MLDHAARLAGAARAFQAQAPAAHAELRYRAALGSLRLAAGLGVDTSLVDTHCDIATLRAHRATVAATTEPWGVGILPGLGDILKICGRD